MQTLNDWKHGDRVYFVDAPQITGTVGSVDDDGVVDVWIDGISNFRISAYRDKLEWYTRPEPEPLGTHLTLSWNAPAFHYGYLQFFKHPERIIIDRILKDGKADLDVEYMACPDCSGEVCSTCGASVSDPIRQGNPMPDWALEVLAEMERRFSAHRIAVGDVVTHADWDGHKETVSRIVPFYAAGEQDGIAVFESGGFWRTSALTKVVAL